METAPQVTELGELADEYGTYRAIIFKITKRLGIGTRPAHTLPKLRNTLDS